MSPIDYKKELFLHIGYPKTGTSFLQQKILLHHNDINFLGKFRPTKNTDIEKIFEEIKHFDDYNFNLNFEKYKNILTNFFDNNYNKNKCNVYSWEGLLNPLEVPNNDLFSSHRRIRKLFDACEIRIKIFLFLRNQFDFLLSYYENLDKKQLKRNNIPTKFNEFIYLIKNDNNENIKIFFKSLNYGQTTENLKSIYNFKNVRIFFYEDFILKKDEIYENISKYLNVNHQYTKYLVKNSNKVNVGRSSIIYKMLTHNIFYRFVISKLLPKNIRNYIKPLINTLLDFVKNFERFKYYKDKKIKKIIIDNYGDYESFYKDFKL